MYSNTALARPVSFEHFKFDKIFVVQSANAPEVHRFRLYRYFISITQAYVYTVHTVNALLEPTVVDGWYRYSVERLPENRKERQYRLKDGASLVYPGLF